MPQAGEAARQYCFFAKMSIPLAAMLILSLVEQENDQ
jgi:hypothetical protein